MSVKSGKFLTVGGGFLLDRLQSTGVSSPNVPTERISEVGNEQTVETLRDVPTVPYELESLDTTVEAEAALCFLDESGLAAGTVIRLTDAKPIDFVSPIKGAGSSKTSVRGVVVPQQYLESASYRFGVRASATQTFTLRGDAQYTIPGTPYREEFAAAGGTTLTFANTAIKVVEKGEDVYALSVCIYKADGSYQRLFHGVDYTDTSTAATLLATPPVGSTIVVCYGSATAATFAQTIHPTPSVKPSAVRGKDIDLYVAVGPSRSFTVATTNTSTSIVGTGSAWTSADIGGVIVAAGIPDGATITAVADATHATISAAATATASGVVTTFSPPLIRWAGVQSVDLNWRVTLDDDVELGNPHIVSSDYDVPEVSGSITMRPVNIEYLFDRIAQIANVPTTEVAGLLSSTPLEMQVRISHPETGARLKTFRVTDSRMIPPGINARVGQKIENQFTWASDGGLLEIIKGAP